MTARWHCASSSSVSPVSSFPNTTAVVPARIPAILSASCSGKRVKYFLFFPRRRVVPATSAASAIAEARSGWKTRSLQDVTGPVREGPGLRRVQQRVRHDGKRGDAHALHCPAGGPHVARVPGPHEHDPHLQRLFHTPGIVADTRSMKKAVLLAFLLAGSAAAALEWKLPVVTGSWETAAGAREDEDDDEHDAGLLPASRRNTLIVRLREEASPATFGLLLKYSVKDYLLEAGDYSYIEAGQDTAVRIGRMVKLGAAVGAKYEQFGQLDTKACRRTSSP